MRFSACKLGLIGGLMLALLQHAPAQGPGTAIFFRNDTKTAIIIQGYSAVGGMIRRGQPIVVSPGHGGGDFNIPPGTRIYTVYDANQPSRILAKDVPLVIPAGANIIASVRNLPNNQVGIVPEGTRP
ncbi:MAG: hypothetical protein WCL32_08720 [Planctomycetota bacterium]|jgi:hypothetical protein